MNRIEQTKNKHIVLQNIIKKIDFIIEKANIQDKKKVRISNTDSEVGIDFIINVEKFNLIKKDFYKKLSEYEDYVVFNTFNNENGVVEYNCNFDVELKKFIENFVQNNIPYKSEIIKMLDQYNHYNTAVIIKKINFDVCCGLKMFPHNNNSELLCTKCDKIIKMDGTFYEDPFFEKHKPKYESTRHCREWLDQLQAKAINRARKTLNADVQKIEDKLKQIYKGNLYYNPSKNNIIPCSKFREILKDKDVNLTWYNNHIPYIRKLITGYIPEQLTSKEENIILLYFAIVESTFEKLIEEDRISEEKEKNKINESKAAAKDKKKEKEAKESEDSKDSEDSSCEESEEIKVVSRIVSKSKTQKNSSLKKSSLKKSSLKKSSSKNSSKNSSKKIKSEDDFFKEDTDSDYEDIEQKTKEKRPNMRYYPYFIYKLFEIHITNVKKLYSLLECIHIQSPDTLDKHDDVWYRICNAAPQLHGKYKPTDKYKNLMIYH